MIKNLILRALGKKPQSNVKSENFINKFKEGSNGLFNLIIQKLEQAKSEIKIIREKSKNLLDTNYKLGLHHLEKGNLQDAVIRFSIIIRFWPNFYEAYYQKAYIQMIQGKAFEAKKTMDKLLNKNPSNLDPKFQTLIEQISKNLELSISDEQNS